MKVELYRTTKPGLPAGPGGTLVYAGMLDLKLRKRRPEPSGEEAEAEVVSLARDLLDPPGRATGERHPLSHGDILTFTHRGLRSLLITPQGFRRLPETISGGGSIAYALRSCSAIRMRPLVFLRTELCGFTVRFAFDHGVVSAEAALAEGHSDANAH